MEQQIPSPNELILQICNREINRDPNLSQKEMNKLTDEEIQNKELYANAKTNKEKQILETRLVEKAQSITMPEQFRKNIADTVVDQESFGHNPVQKLGEFTEDFARMVSGQSPVTYKEKQPGHKLSNGKWMSFDEIIEKLNGMKVDSGSRVGIKTLVDDVVRKAEDIKPGENATFNYQKEFNNVKNKVIETGNLESLTHDKIFGNRVFKDDLQSAIQMGTYKELGLTDVQVERMDPTPEDKITQEDAQIITDTIIKDKNLLTNYLSEYYTKALEQNWDNNLSEEVRKNKKMNQSIPQSIKQAEQTKPQVLKGGSINENGVFVPNSKKDIDKIKTSPIKWPQL